MSICNVNFRKSRVFPGQRANLLVMAKSENKVNYIKQILQLQLKTPTHRWTKIRPDPRFPDSNREAPIIALGATKPMLAKKDFYTSLLAAWSVPMMQGFQQIEYVIESGRSQRDYFLSDLINMKIGSPYPSMGSHFGKL